MLNIRITKRKVCDVCEGKIMKNRAQFKIIYGRKSINITITEDIYKTPYP